MTIVFLKILTFLLLIHFTKTQYTELQKGYPRTMINVDEAKFNYFVIRFTNERSMGRSLFIKASPCSGFVSIYLSKDEIPTQTRYDMVSKGRGEHYLKFEWDDPMIVYVGVYGEISSTFNIVTDVAELESDSTQLGIIISYTNDDNYINIKWKTPNDMQLPLQ
jgi:hypothetical protein